MPNEWFCNVCRSENQDPAMLPVYKGAFRFLHEQADKKNSSAYSLPKHTRERFEGVRTGADGEYEDIVPPAPKPSRLVESFFFPPKSLLSSSLSSTWPFCVPPERAGSRTVAPPPFSPC